MPESARIEPGTVAMAVVHSSTSTSQFELQSRHKVGVDANCIFFAHFRIDLKWITAKNQAKKPPFIAVLHRKKSFSIFPPPAGMSLTKLSQGGNNDVINKLFPPRESLVSDIPAGDGNIEKFFTVWLHSPSSWSQNRQNLPPVNQKEERVREREGS
jgi:hypothetical protein